MIRLLIVMFLVVSLSGCKWLTRVEYVEVPQAVFHPERPEIVQKPRIHLESRVIDEESVIVTSREDAARLTIWLNDILQYIKKSNNILCIYRRELKEPECAYILDNDVVE